MIHDLCVSKELSNYPSRIVTVENKPHRKVSQETSQPRELRVQVRAQLQARESVRFCRDEQRLPCFIHITRFLNFIIFPFKGFVAPCHLSLLKSPGHGK